MTLWEVKYLDEDGSERTKLFEDPEDEFYVKLDKIGTQASRKPADAFYTLPATTLAATPK